ncbi:protein containing tetratricopeptide repeat [Oceanobacter sp. RED65]|uniref:Protein containing tetratricopeptide repeat n=2 Tax=Bermanella marisrubri TaxID=207949 RepID=Q1N3Q4_9GAMM|nr:protein containing tetratricopeptide repeat [Oceanobacter sp. RED65] [Bermanella marisrubri]
MLMVAHPSNAQDSTPDIQETEKQLKQLELLVNARQFDQAYSLASSIRNNEEGRPSFDFYYGLAAIETGHFDEALFAFERLLFYQPNNPRYRLELARVHFYLRNLKRSESEFKQVLKQNPPAPVRNNVKTFLDKIAELYRQVEPEFMLALDLAGGYDSNINSATSEDELPQEELIFPVDIVLSEDAKETASAYWSTLIHFAYLRPISKTQSLDVRAIYNKRANSETSLYDLDTLIAEGAYGFFTGPIRWRLTGRYQSVLLDSESFLSTLSFLGNGRWRQPNGASYGIGFNLGQSEYDDNPNGDIQQMQYKFTYQSPPKKSNWTISAFFGLDDAKESINKYNGKSYQGFSVQQTTLHTQRSSYYWMINITASEYDAINTALYSKLREDISLHSTLGWRYNITSKLSFRNDYSASYQDSSLEANTYQRFKAELGITYRM